MPRSSFLIITAFLMLVPVSKAQKTLPGNGLVQHPLLSGETLSLNASLAGAPRADKLKAVSVPADFPKAGLELWFSAGQVDRANGDITAIEDMSGNGNNASRNLDSTAPSADPALAVDAASGKPVLRFSGENMAFGFKRLTDIRTAFWVVSKDPAAFGKLNERCVLGDTVSHDFHAGWTDDTIFNTVYDNPNPSGHLSKYLHDGKTWLNGQPMDASKTPFPKQLGVISIESTRPVEANQLARDRQFAGRSWQGDIAEVLLFNVVLSDADRQAVEKYLMVKYQIKPGVNPTTTASTSNEPALPGKGAAQHPFVYAGEWDTRKPLEQSIFIVREGKVTWQYSMPIKTPSGGNQEFDDATLLSNGNVVFSRMSGRGWSVRTKRSCGITRLLPEPKCTHASPSARTAS